MALHVIGFFDSGNIDTPKAQAFDLRQKMEIPLLYGKYGVGIGAIFGSLMWLIVVTLTDSAEGKPQGPSDHWAQNNSVLLVVLLGLGTATGGVLGFTMAAVTDIISQGRMMETPIVSS